jgi:DNA-binding transcriptional LysR family regulator
MGGINSSRLKLSQLRALVAIADTGSFSEAALRIDLSQSAVSHAIATLEEELGVVLLSRSRQGAVLTPTGEQITNDARQVLRSLESICRKAENGQRVAGGGSAHCRLSQCRHPHFAGCDSAISPEVSQH